MVGEKERLERGREESNPVLNFWLELATSNPSHFLDMAQYGVKLTQLKISYMGKGVSNLVPKCFISGVKEAVGLFKKNLKFLYGFLLHR